jgi:hypothetical protein
MSLPFPERVLHQHIATLGKTGSGKSSALRVIAEHLLDKQRRIAIVDPKGDWWGLKSSASGKSAGYPVIMFGDFKEPRATDVPINDRSGKHVAELIATGNRPCVLGFRGWMPAQLVRFWLDFAPALFNANEGELYVIIDEVHNFAPKGKIFDPDAGKCLHWTNRIMSEGRGLGLTFFIASQRPQKVHNDTLDNCETLIAMRVAHPAARQALKDWIDGNGDPKRGTEVLNTLAQLKRGEAWIWSPENNFGPDRVQFPMFQTFDSFAPPQLQKKVSQAGWSEVDLDQVKEKLSAVIAEAKANDPKELKAEVTRLKQELRQRPAETKVVTEEKTVEVKVVSEKQIAELQALVVSLSAVGTSLSASLASVSSRKALTPQRPMTARPAKLKAVPSRPAVTSNHHNSDLSAAQVRVLSRLVELTESTGKESVRKEQLAAWAEYSPNSGGFNNYLGGLRTAGMIHYPQPGMVAITDQGLKHSAPEDVPTTSDEMLARAKRVLGGSEGKLLELLHESRETTAKTDLAEAAGFSPNSGGFNNYLGHMRTLGFIEYPQPGQVKCADWLYLNGDAA